MTRHLLRTKAKAPPVIDAETLNALLDASIALAIHGMVMNMVWEIIEENHLADTDPDYRVAIEIKRARYKPVKEVNSGECS